MIAPIFSLFMAAAPLPAVPNLPPLPKGEREIQLTEETPKESQHWPWSERTIYNTDINLEFTQNVVRPSLLYFAPDPQKANGTAVIVAPGGGGVNLTIRNEGTTIAERLGHEGVAAFVLKYRLVGHPTDSPMSKAYARDAAGVVLEGPQKGEKIRPMAIEDAKTAMAWLRAHAAEFRCDPHRIGVVGFSAGGDLACELVDGDAATRPDFFAPIYGVNSKLKPKADSPPVFLATAYDDEWDAPKSVALFTAWREAKRPAELHVFQTGGHGFLKRGGGGDKFLDRLIDWMRTNGWLDRAK